MVEIRGPRLCGVPSEREECCRVDSQGWHPGLVCDAPSGHRIGNVVGVGYRNHGGPTVLETGWGPGIGNVIVPFALVGKLTDLRSRFESVARG